MLKTWEWLIWHGYRQCEDKNYGIWQTNKCHLEMRIEMCGKSQNQKAFESEWQHFFLWFFFLNIFGWGSHFHYHNWHVETGNYEIYLVAGNKRTQRRKWKTEKSLKRIRFRIIVYARDLITIVPKSLHLHLAFSLLFLYHVQRLNRFNLNVYWIFPIKLVFIRSLWTVSLNKNNKNKKSGIKANAHALNIWDHKQAYCIRFLSS